MRLNLQKPLVIFDLETTGLDLVKDRIIQISYIKVFPDGKEDDTHLSLLGAVFYSGLIAEGLRELGGIYAELLADDAEAEHI